MTVNAHRFIAALLCVLGAPMLVVGGVCKSAEMVGGGLFLMICGLGLAHRTPEPGPDDF